VGKQALTQLLYLHENSFTGAVPSELGSLTAIKSFLHLNKNSLSGTLPSQVTTTSRF
jgi:hypothetical protein